MISAGLKLKNPLHRPGDCLSRPAPARFPWCRQRRSPVRDGRDRVSDLQFGHVGQSGRDDVLRHPAAHIRGGTVDFGRILAGKGSASVATPAAVRVDNDLAPGKSGVPVRASDGRNARVGLIKYSVREVMRPGREYEPA